ncbi:hypothetical protein ANN_07680 [Periplaneta americana]|uniref:Uncharacterized protein n=1 Tax=Periplaneta americana TaxID=6978 RepID=A0ABQ8SZB7_PERAM|nr:hypothetical protein ANN_07680 [Periplaneta americana]
MTGLCEGDNEPPILPIQCMGLVPTQLRDALGQLRYVAKVSYNDWQGHHVNHMIPSLWLDDRPSLLRYVNGGYQGEVMELDMEEEERAIKCSMCENDAELLCGGYGTLEHNTPHGVLLGSGCVTLPNLKNDGFALKQKRPVAEIIRKCTVIISLHLISESYSSIEV